MTNITPNGIIYGTPAQIVTVERAHALWALLRNDPRFCFQGRTVSVTGLQSDTADLVIALSRLEGYSSCHFCPRDRAPALAQAYVAAGLTPTTWDQYWGHQKAIAASQAFMSEFTPPEGAALKMVEPDTPDDVIRRICETSAGAGVMPIPGSVMRGAGPRGLMLYVEGTDGQVLATGGAYMAYHPDSARATEAFWGMLATDAAWRGRRLACWVGAQAILTMADRFGALGFSSGVKPDNPASQSMCSRLGVTRSDMVYAAASNPAIIGHAPVTR